MPRRNLDDLRALAAVADLAAAQHGVISRRQARELGLSEGGIARARARGSWRVMHRGVAYVGSGMPGLDARMWAAHLALDGVGVVAGRAAGLYWGLLPGSFGFEEQVLMYVPTSLHRTPTGMRTRRVEDPAARAHPARVPAVLSVEHTVLDLVRASATPEGGVEVVLRACRLGLTTPARLRATMAGQPRVRWRGLLDELCVEAVAGVTSSLERRYRRDVAQAHALPIEQAQVRDASAGGVVYRDVVFEAFGVIVELDGRLGHESEPEAFRDQWRDNHATLTGLATLRFGWLGIVASPCAAAGQIGSLLTLRGWRGRVRTCGPNCTVPPSLLAA